MATLTGGGIRFAIPPYALRRVEFRKTPKITATFGETAPI
jgi:hypothetical protein